MTVPPAEGTPRPWTPDQPLRADATDEQMWARYGFLAQESLLSAAADQTASILASVAREFAAACVVDARRAPLAEGPIARCESCGGRGCPVCAGYGFFVRNGWRRANASIAPALPPTVPTPAGPEDVSDAMVEAGAKQMAFRRMHLNLGGKAEDYDPERVWESWSVEAKESWRIEARDILTAALRSGVSPRTEGGET